MNHELNAQVAENVMGFIWVRDDDIPGRWLQPKLTVGRSPAIGTERIVNAHARMPDFSGSIEAAWTVVERMQQLGYGYCVNTYNDTHAAPPTWDGPVHCNFFKEEGGDRINNDGYGSNAMEAICDAALKACARNKA